MVSRTGQYALKILGYLVGTQGQRIPGEEIARATGIPANYLAKVLNQLRKQGFVMAVKGRRGGFEVRAETLSRPIRDILAAIDGAESTEHNECLFGLSRCDADNPCPLHAHWEQIRRIHTDMLGSTTVADLEVLERG